MLSTAEDGRARMYASAEYVSFRANVPQRKICVDDESERAWICFETGPRHLSAAVVFLPPVCGRADCYHRQLPALGAKGCRAIALEWPPYFDIQSFCRSLAQVFDVLNLKRAHIFGSSLGGYLAQRFAESLPHRVASLMLCNSFTNTAIFDRNESSYIYWALPNMILKRIVLTGLPDKAVEREIAESIDFMVECLDGMSQTQLASRLTLNCARSCCDAEMVKRVPITILDVFDDCALSGVARDSLLATYPQAKRAHLKTGGNFPFLSRSAEVNLHILIHVRRFCGTEQSAMTEDLPNNNTTVAESV